ncbi:MAG: hypothetical protein U5L09_10435 [Bacteroidales bacterium]|nr:hypothetical protein [Bacteroidales bacterium]
MNRNHWHSHSEIIGTVQIEITILKELKKQKVKLSLSEESEWMQYFNEQKQKANELQTQITQTDREIDRMVYDLYGLTDEEIRIVEESVG